MSVYENVYESMTTVKLQNLSLYKTGFVSRQVS